MDKSWNQSHKRQTKIDKINRKSTNKWGKCPSLFLKAYLTNKQNKMRASTDILNVKLDNFRHGEKTHIMGTITFCQKTWKSGETDKFLEKHQDWVHDYKGLLVRWKSKGCLCGGKWRSHKWEETNPIPKRERTKAQSTKESEAENSDDLPEIWHETRAVWPRDKATAPLSCRLS